MEANLGVHVSIPLSGNKTIALESPTGHQDEDAKGGLTKPEAFDDGLAM
jgi:hypothetical protein